MPPLAKKFLAVTLRPVAWMNYWLTEALAGHRRCHPDVQLLETAAAVAVFRVLDLDALWEHHPDWQAERGLPNQIQTLLSLYSREEWERLKGMAASEENFIRSNLEQPRLWGDLASLRRRPDRRDV
jgi:hypothetical protein